MVLRDNGIPLIRYHIADDGGLICYPQMLGFLADHGFDPVAGWVTGKFVLESREDADRHRYLAIAVELAPGVDATPDRQQTITESILSQLRRLNSVLAHYTPPEYQTPRVTLHPAGDPEHVPPGIKHRYTR